MQSPLYGNGGRRGPRRQPVPKPPDTAPQLIFRGTGTEEPPEVAEFKQALTTNPANVRDALLAKRSGAKVEGEIAALAGVITRLITSPHWESREGRPSGIGLDQTTQDRYVVDYRGDISAIGAMELGNPKLPAAQARLRLGMLATLATRAVDAAHIDELANQGYIYVAKGATPPVHEAG